MTRKAKDVIVYCADEDRAGVLAYVLRQQSKGKYAKYRVQGVSDPAMLRPLVDAWTHPGCIVVLRCKRDARASRFLSSLKALRLAYFAMRRNLVVFQIVKPGEYGIKIATPALKGFTYSCTFDVLNVIDAACERKRGPQLFDASVLGS